MRVLSPTSVLSAMLLTAAAFVTPVLGQPGSGLPQGVVGSATIGSSEQKAIDDHVARWLGDLSSKEADKVKKAREALVAPVLEQNVTVPFRLAYSQALVAGKLGDLCKSDQETTAINALRLAGEVAEIQTVGLVREGFSDKRSAVRYAAVFAALRTFEQMSPATRAVAIPSNTAEQLVSSVASALNKDKEEVLIVDAASRALLSAARIDRPKYEGVSKQASVEVCAGLAKRLAAAGKDDATVVEAGVRAAGQFQALLGGAKGAQVDAGVRKEAAGLGADLIAWVCRQLNAGAVPQQDVKGREAYAVALAAGENTVLSAVKAAGTPVPGAVLVPSFQLATKGGDAKVVVDATRMVSDVLGKPPFDLPASRFKLK